MEKDLKSPGNPLAFFRGKNLTEKKGEEIEHEEGDSVIREGIRVRLLDSTVDPMFVICAAARTCYQSADDLSKREGFIRGLIKRGHTAPLEFANFVFDISGISRVCLAQLTRHRIASYCVESQRYCSASDNDVVIPVKAIMADDSAADYMRAAKRYYNKLISAGVPKEDARYFLPMGTTCALKMGINLRSLRNFFKLRLDRHAQWEIRLLAGHMYDIIAERWPVFVEDL